MEKAKENGMPVNVAALVEFYQRAQGNIIKSILEGNNLARKQALLSEINKVLATLQEQTEEWINKNIPVAYREGMAAVNEEYAKQYAKAGKKVPFEYPTEFSVLNRKAISILVDNVTADFDAAINFVGRKIKDDIQKASVQVIADKTVLGSTVKKTRDILAKQLSEQGVSAIKYIRNGKPAYMRLETYAETVARSTTAEATNTASITQVQAIGNDLVQMTSHSSSCPICMPLEGRVYSISGKTEGYPPLDRAYTGEYANIHPNCGHRLVPYVAALQDDDTLAKDKAFSNRSFDINKWNDKDKARAQENLAAYNRGQEKKRALYVDRRQWERYKTALPNDTPKTLSGFRRMKKASGSQNFRILQAQYKGVGYYNKVVANEAIITEQVTKVANKIGMVQEGLEFRIKDKDSFLRKVRTNYTSTGNEYEINDILRYTYSADSNTLVDKTLQSIANHEQTGYNTVKIKNYWLDKQSPYKGINTFVQAPNGQKFELQYHTPESFQLKNGKLHELYEKARALDTRSDEFARLRDDMLDLSKELTLPSKIKDVKNKR